MREYIALLNDVYRFQVPYQAALARRYPRSKFTLFDVNSLVNTPLHLLPERAQALRGRTRTDMAIVDGRHVERPGLVL